MIFANVSFGIFALMPQGWLFMLFIILIESLILSKALQLQWFNWPIYFRVLISNAISGLVGLLASLKLNGGWWLVVWFPWVSDNEVREGDFIQLWIVYGIAFFLTLLIEIPINRWLLKKYQAQQTIKFTLVANVGSYVLGTLVLYSYSFGIIRPTESDDFYPLNTDFKRFTELLNQNSESVEKALKEVYKVETIERDVKSKDSVRLLVNTNPSESFTFIILKDTLKYFGLYQYHSYNEKLIIELSRQFRVDSLSGLKGEILENYNNEDRSALNLFKDEENGFGFLVVDYKRDSGRYAKMVVWKLKK